MSAALVEGKEGDVAAAAAAQAQEERWQDLAAHGDEVGKRDVLMGATRLSDEPGTGAAAGLAYALAAVGARLLPATPYIADAAGLGTEAALGADLILGVGSVLTPRSLDHGIAVPVAATAGSLGIPAALLAPGVRVGKRDLMAAGISSAHEAAEGPEGLADGVRRFAHTWARA
jgi:glycerate kinase